MLLFCQVIQCGRVNVTRADYGTGQDQIFDREGTSLCLVTCKPSVLNCLLLMQPMLLASRFPIYMEHLDAIMLQ
jgi:hypothetical protein